MTRTLERIIAEVEDPTDAQGIQIDVRGLRRMRLTSAVTDGAPADVSVTLAGEVGGEAWPPEGEAVAILDAQERLGEMLREMARPEHAEGVLGVARALAGTLGGGEATWWWLSGESGHGAVVVGDQNAWAAWVADPS